MENNVENEIEDLVKQTDDCNLVINGLKQKIIEFKKCLNITNKKIKKEKKEKKEGDIKIKRLPINMKLYRGGLNFYKYRENAVEAGFQNPPEIILGDIIKDYNEIKKNKKKKNINKD